MPDMSPRIFKLEKGVRYIEGPCWKCGAENSIIYTGPVWKTKSKEDRLIGVKLTCISCKKNYKKMITKENFKLES